MKKIVLKHYIEELTGQLINLKESGYYPEMRECEASKVDGEISMLESIVEDLNSRLHMANDAYHG